MQASSRSPTRRFALALAIATMSGASAADISSIDVGSTPRWLAGDDRGVSALLADGRVVSIRGKEVVARGEGLSPDAPLHDCAGELLGVASDGALVSIDTNNRVSRSAAALLSPRGGLACAFAAAWGIAADGRLLRFERRGRQWVAVKQASAEALPDARIVLSDLAGNGAAKLFVLAEGSATRYRHGVLGDAVEPTALLMIDPDSLAIEARLALPAPMVFEDLLPRPLSIAARPALALVRASPSGGAAFGADRHRAHQPRHRRQRPRFRSVLALAQPLVGASSLYAVLTPHIGECFTATSAAATSWPRCRSPPGCRPIASAAVSSRARR